MKRIYRVMFLKIGNEMLGQGVSFAERFIECVDLVAAYYEVRDRHDCVSVLCVEQMTKKRMSIQYVEEVEH